MGDETGMVKTNTIIEETERKAGFTSYSDFRFTKMEQKEQTIKVDKKETKPGTENHHNP